ncbi:MAG: multidrug efflux system membrane fusion protein, partial [Saprospiraceae bacterium]
VVNTIRPVKYGTVVMSGDASSETFSGTAQSSKETKLSFKVGGAITTLNVKVGDLVGKGQLIAKIDQTDYAVQFEQSVASLKSVETQIQSAKTQLINSKATYKRVEKLYENNSLSISDFEQAKSAYELAESSYNASLAQARASEKKVESAQNQVNYAKLVAPFSGVITSVNVEENELVGAGNPIATISAIGDPEILVGIPEIFISKVKKDQGVDIIFSSTSNMTFSGKVYEVSYSSMGGSTYPVTVRIDQPTEDIRPGMAADVRFNFNEQKGMDTQKMVAPVAAVGEDSNGYFVFSLAEEGENYLVKKKQIQIGQLTPSGFEIKSGLAKGDLVATAGLSTLLDGMKVRLITQK